MTKCSEMPYDELETEDLLDAIEKGYRLPCPNSCPEDVYSIMLSCWKFEPAERPEFGTMLGNLQEAARQARLNRQPSTRAHAPPQNRFPPKHVEDPNTLKGRSMYENVVIPFRT